MNDRQRFHAVARFAEVDKIPLTPGSPRESTLEMWRTQGLTEGADYYSFLMQTLGIPWQPPRVKVDLGVSFKMIPWFEEKVLEHSNGHYIVQDWMGAITEISDEFDYTYIRSAKDFVTRKWHRFPVQTRADWEEHVKWRYDARHPDRFPSDFAERCRLLRERDHVLSINVNGPFWQLREWLGLENLCMMMVEDPDFVQEMIDLWTGFVMDTLQPILSSVDVDEVHLSEDMAYKEHSMISPAMCRRFLLPTWTAWTKMVTSHGQTMVAMDSDGYIGELIPLWIEAGMILCDPIEVAAGNDIVDFRRRFGKRMAYRGGIDKRALARGGAEMRAELMRVVPPLLKDGGFMPGCDHGVPPDISWPNFVAYTHLLAELTGWM